MCILVNSVDIWLAVFRSSGVQEFRSSMCKMLFVQSPSALLFVGIVIVCRTPDSVLNKGVVGWCPRSLSVPVPAARILGLFFMHGFVFA